MTPKIGLEAEQFVADYLAANHWQILARRYCSRWGELDLVALQGDTLSFVEVKARRANNWDCDGLLSITPSKQRKLCLTATAFLRAWPSLDRCDGRFDVVLVKILPSPKFSPKFSIVKHLTDAFTVGL